MKISKSETLSRVRLDRYLIKKLPKYSRSFLKSQIKAGNVLVNEKIKKPSCVLKKGDEIEINFTTREKHELQPNPDIKLNIVYEDKNIIVLDKPAGISTHPAEPNQTDTLVNGLLAYCPDIKGVGDAPEIRTRSLCSRNLDSSLRSELRPGIVHRLDKDTSGLMVIAKNNETFAWLKKQFQERKVIKKYLALVVGKIKENKGIISKAISRAKGSIKRTITPRAGAREAVTYYKTIKEYQVCHPEQSEGSHRRGDSSVVPLSQNDKKKREENYTLLEAEPKTGRTHQIRVHLASIGHPIAGDKLYGFKRQSQLAGSKRQFLHASYLKFILPDGKMVEFVLELPSDLKDTIKNLKS